MIGPILIINWKHDDVCGWSWHQRHEPWLRLTSEEIIVIWDTGIWRNISYPMGDRWSKIEVQHLPPPHCFYFHSCTIYLNSPTIHLRKSATGLQVSNLYCNIVDSSKKKEDNVRPTAISKLRRMGQFATLIFMTDGLVVKLICNFRWKLLSPKILHIWRGAISGR